MKLSVLDLAPVYGGTGHGDALKQALRLAQTAEALGYHRYWVAEHHDLAGLACTAPEVLLAHIGALTSRIRLGSGALLLPHYKPLKVAEAFRLLAALYPGRIDLGIGRAPGGPAHASMALSGNFLDNVRRLPESLKDLLELLSDRYELEGQPVRARPIPAVAPQVWLLGTNHRSAAYAAQFGTGYVFGSFMSETDGKEVLAAYRAQFQPSEASAEARVIAAVGVVCAPTLEEARELAAAGATLFLERVPGGGQSSAEPQSSGRKYVVGTPEQVAAELKELEREYGADEFLLVTPIPDYDLRIRSYELAAQALLG